MTVKSRPPGQNRTLEAQKPPRGNPPAMLCRLHIRPQRQGGSPEQEILAPALFLQIADNMDFPAIFLESGLF